MARRVLRLWVAMTLMASGTLLYAASWQRWAGACPWVGDRESQECGTRMDHLYDLFPHSEPWMPIGVAAQLAGASLLVLAVALLPLPWALTGRRPGPGSAAALFVTVLGVVAVGLAALRSGLSGDVVRSVVSDVTMLLWFLVLPLLFGHLAVLSRGWARAAGVLLVLASPLVASFTYAIGPFDAQPWWEAISGLLTGGAGACVLVEAVRRPARRRDAIVEPADVV